MKINRRNFLKTITFGGATFIAGRFFGPLLSMNSKDKVVSEDSLKNYKIIETNKQFKLKDQQGEDIIIVDKTC